MSSTSTPTKYTPVATDEGEEGSVDEVECLTPSDVYWRIQRINKRRHDPRKHPWVRAVMAAMQETIENAEITDFPLKTRECEVPVPPPNGQWLIDYLRSLKFQLSGPVLVDCRRLTWVECCCGGREAWIIKW